MPVEFERRRNDAARPMFEGTLAWATFRPFPPEIYARRAAARNTVWRGDHGAIGLCAGLPV